MNKPLPIGYVEVQRAWVGLKPFSEIDPIVAMVRETMARDYPGHVQHGARIERTVDGAGEERCTLYMGFAPRSPTTPPLDPTNLNDAPAPQIGHAALDIVPLGTKERKF